MLQDTAVYIRRCGVFSYPDKPPFNPDRPYPEYPFSSEALRQLEKGYENPVYDNIRRLLYEMGLDRKNYGLPCWNPLKEYIKPGDTVLLKPNIVLHENHLRHYGLDCVITHGSIVRAIADYVYIALKGCGKIIIGDAPIQACKFDKAIRHMGLAEIKGLYKKHGFDVEIIDFRQEMALLDNRGKICAIKKLSGDPRGYSRIDLNKESMHDEVSELYESFRVTNYDPARMKEHHNRQVHEYLIPNSVLQADFVINLPKPKTHRKAGMTGAMKNLVGINGSKDWLPHHRRGSISEKGDEYLQKDTFKRIHTYLQEKIDISSIRGRKRAVACLRLLQMANGIFRKGLARDDYREGSWWGNDTIWRTICDLNRLFIYADREGRMADVPQRKCLSLLDMIISGEGEGPLRPSPKPAGIIMAGINPLAVDTVAAGIMGFDYNKIPHIKRAYSIRTYPICSFAPEDIIIHSNTPEWMDLSCIKYDNTLKYKPSSGWKGHIELK